MSKTIKMYYHGGSKNHGCEAIIRATAKIFGEKMETYTVFPEDDAQYDLGEDVVLIPDLEQPLKKPSFHYYLSALGIKLCSSTLLNTYFRWRSFFHQVEKGCIYLSTGGDNYCYTDLDKLRDYNTLIHKRGGKTVLWSCSVEPSVLQNPEVAKDLASYDAITARETISYEVLKQINPNTHLVSDVAFVLNRKDLPLPTGWMEGKMVGINASPLILTNGDGQLVMEAYRNLIRCILETTDLGIALIPHVVWEHNDDRTVLMPLFEEFRHTGRVLLLDDHNCMELKGYIARCRFFIGARTHATIAAYSQMVPTLVLGYSVKSRGIARDIFGSEEHYVIPVQSMTDPNALAASFNWLLAHETDIRTHLEKVMPEYRKKAHDGRKVLSLYTGVLEQNYEH